MLKIAIIGTTSWGTTLGVIIAQKGMQVRLWARTKKEATELSVNGPDANFFAGVTFPPQLLITSQLKEALADVKVVIVERGLSRCKSGNLGGALTGNAAEYKAGGALSY